MGNCENIGSCDDERMEKLEAYMDGQLSDSEKSVVKAHLEECEECARECDVEKIIRDALKRCCSEKAPESLKAKLQTLE